MSENNFWSDWLKISRKKNTLLCAGLDLSPDFKKHLANRSADILTWSQNYLEAIAPYAAAVKVNLGYWNEPGDKGVLKHIIRRMKKLDLLPIADSKIADLGFTNDAWLHSYEQLGFAAVTLAPYAGNIEESVHLAHKRNLAAITMGLMSNAEYRTEMNFQNAAGEKLWETRVKRSLMAGVDGLVVGGTYPADEPELQQLAKLTGNKSVFYLVPGIGVQGGDIKELVRAGIDIKRCIINTGRDLMFPQGFDSTPREQLLAAKRWQKIFQLVDC